VNCTEFKQREAPERQPASMPDLNGPGRATHIGKTWRWAR
jgi:hypothetical protein